MLNLELLLNRRMHSNIDKGDEKKGIGGKKTYQVRALPEYTRITTSNKALRSGIITKEEKLHILVR